MKPPGQRPLFLGVLVLVISGAWAAMVVTPHVMARASMLDGLETAFLDMRVVLLGPADPAPDVVIVAIDDATLTYAQDTNLTARAVLAHTLDHIADIGAGAVGVDVILADAGDADVTADLAAALGRGATVIAAGGRFTPDTTTPHTILRPHPAFAQAADVGLVNLSTDAHGVPRYAPMVFTTDRGIEPSFPMAVAARFLQVAPTLAPGHLTLGHSQLPLDIGAMLPIRLIGPQGHIPTYSARDVMTGMVASELAGKAVLVGYTATAFGDTFPTPFEGSVPGVEILAGVVSQMLGGPTLRRDPGVRRVDAAVGIVLAVVAAGLVVTLPLSMGVPAAFGAGALWGAGVIVAFYVGVWMGAAVPLVAAIVPIVGAGGLRYVIENRRAARGVTALAALKQFQSPALAEMIARDPAFLQHPTARPLSIFFVDLSGFTALSERLGPAKTQELLKQFHQLTAQAIETHGGVVLNYMGDGALAVFGMTDAETPADQALAASFALIDDLRALAIACRIGLHHGDVVVSRLGGDQHHQVSVAGDVVNLTNRLLEIAKTEHAVLAVTDTVMQMASTRAFRACDVTKPVAVRGRSGSVDVHFWKA
ncbi:adenylate/guanylate cyclase domain-containing protein [Roseobacter sp.]|uniref:CHASE2 domain-containing protein n=1 Tax=Roseobacter sp. TaxID=1907202 RepID=UPI003296989B